MKRSTILLVAAAAVAVSGCADKRVIDGKTYEPYGFANEGAREDPSIRYEVSFGSLAVGIIFCETMLAPLYVAGWDLFQPIEKRSAAKP